MIFFSNRQEVRQTDNDLISLTETSIRDHWILTSFSLDRNSFLWIEITESIKDTRRKLYSSTQFSTNCCINCLQMCQMCDFFSIHADNQFTTFLLLFHPYEQKSSEWPSHRDKLALPKLSFKQFHVQPLLISIGLSISIHVNKTIQLSRSVPKALPLLQLPSDQRIYDEWDKQRP